MSEQFIAEKANPPRYDRLHVQENEDEHWRNCSSQDGPQWQSSFHTKRIYEPRPFAGGSGAEALWHIQFLRNEN